ncbi:PIG-L family deacetylase [Streptomyces sp. NPDC021749]|uniref:PIG-L family deacetylase n=1 Tax=Streptomyces sp. NPDC021749 TaxID=3154905 RepID=UPI0033C52D2F
MSPPRPPRVTRRRLLQLTGGGLLAAAAGTGVWAHVIDEGPRTGRPAGSGPPLVDPADQSFLHVIAHPDDGLYFMNPDLEQAVRAGARSVTVCLTGGESDGHNVSRHARYADRVPRDRPAFARARTNGLRAAHAEMAVGDPRAPWHLTAISLLPGFQAELHTLQAAPHQQLLFFELVEARAVWQARTISLRGLWLGATPFLPTLRPAGTPVRHQFLYRREQVVAALVAVLDRVRPTVVRTLDPNAVHSRRRPPAGPDHDPRLAGLRYYDHQDHTASAYFAQAALAVYRPRGGRPPIVENYLGYEAGALPNDVDLKAARRKARLLSVYGWADHRRCGDPAGCGDRKVGGSALDGGSRNWTRSTRLRAPGSNAWLRPAQDGRLAAFAVLGGTAYCWAETRPGSGLFRAPVPAGGTMLQGQIHAVRRPDGSLQLFASRTVLPDRTAVHRRELMTAAQRGTAPDGTPLFGRWESLGSPDPDPERSLEIGFPVAVAAPDGTVHVFVRTWDGNIAHRAGPGGTGFTPWQRLEGTVSTLKASPQVVDGLDACVDSDGLIHVAAPGIGTVVHWVSKEPGRTPRPAAATGLPQPGGPVSLVPLADGVVRTVYRRSVTAQVLIAERHRRIGGWRVAAQCAPVGGYGRVAAAPVGRGDRMVLAARDEAGEVRMAMAQDAPKPWQPGRVSHSAAAGAAQDAAGRAVVVALGTDGRLYAARQTSVGQTALFGAWRPQTGSPERTGDAPA